MQLRDLEEIEEAAEIVVDDCRMRLVNLQTRVERRKKMLQEVKITLSGLKVENINEEDENNMLILDTRKSGMEEGITLTRKCQRIIDEKMEELLVNLEGKCSRIVEVDKKLTDEKKRLVDIEHEIERKK